MASRLASLAVEIVELIADALDPIDLFSLRCVCKELNRKTLHYFGRTCITIVRTDFTHENLKKLQELSEKELFKIHVQTLSIKTSLNFQGQGFNELERDSSWHRNPSGYLEAPPLMARILGDILVKRLVNCRSFHIHGYDDVGRLYESGILTPSDAVGIVLAIIAEHSLPVKSFFVHFTERGTGRLDVKRLQLPLYQQPGFRFGWAHLRELYLQYSIDFNDSDWAMHLILHAPRLQKLSLGFYHNIDIPLIDRLTSRYELPRLQYLSLSFAYVTVESILRLLVNSHDSLRELSFRHVAMKSGSTWERFFRESRAEFSALESISVLRPSENVPEHNTHVRFPKLLDNPVVPGSETTSLPRSDCRLLKSSGLPIRLTYKKMYGKVKVIGVSYHGSEMNSILEILAESAENTAWYSAPAT